MKHFRLAYWYIVSIRYVFYSAANFEKVMMMMTSVGSSERE